MKQQLTEQEFEAASKELDDCTFWIDKASDTAWVMMPGTFDVDELEKAKMNGRAEEFVKSNYAFSAPFSQLSNKKKWVYRDANNNSAQVEK
ncbi:hypothetical protein BGZ54_001630 [Gamsiella multidivaricata]|nr:hypothetical protein BGZ54_001630 [Gamsiella multidivaricata]